MADQGKFSEGEAGGKGSAIRGKARKKPRSALRTIASIAISALGIAGLALFIFQDNIARFSIAPRKPLHTTPAPPMPEYGARGAWILWPDTDATLGLADVFYVHSTTYYSAKGWNAPIGDTQAELVLRRDAIPNEAGPFATVGRIYAPRYRQATLFAFFTHKFDGTEARRIAYGDVRRAFEHFVQVTESARPIILVGYGQGGLHIQRLLIDYFQTDPDLRSRLAAAYMIDNATPITLFEGPLRQTPPCNAVTDIRCIVSYADFERTDGDEIERYRRRSMNWTTEGELEPVEGKAILCVNPLSWTISEARAAPDVHLGAASATGLRFGATPAALPKAVGASCANGTLIVDRPTQSFLRRRDWMGAKWRARTYNLFFFDLRHDAERRATETARLLKEEAMRLDPIGEAVELEASPIHKPADR
jgi:hypothetical protein